MFNIIFPIIIFVSLAIIVFILGKHLPEFMDIKKNTPGEAISAKKGGLKKILITVLNLFKNVVIWLVDQIIKRIKNFLTLIQAWVVENKGEKIIKNETDSLKEDDSERERESFVEKITKKEVATEGEEKRPQEEKKKRERIKKTFFSNFKDNLKNKILEKKRKKIDQVFQDSEDIDSRNQFSDGIVSIQNKNQGQQEDAPKGLINEVVEVKRLNNKMTVDDEIGVDRHILEKKLISKIAKNPKDKEVYRQLGELYLKMGDFNDAENCYRQVLRIAIRDVDAIRKIERIKLLKRSQK